MPRRFAGRAACLWLGLLAPSALMPGSAAAAELSVTVTGESRSSSLSVSVELPASLAGADGAWMLRLPERYPVQRAEDSTGRALELFRDADLVTIRGPGKTLPTGATTLHYSWPLGKPLDEMLFIVGRNWLPTAQDAGEAPAVVVNVTLPPPFLAVSSGTGSHDAEAARFEWRNDTGERTPLVIGRLTWHERRRDAGAIRVFLPEKLAARRAAIADLLEEASDWLTGLLGFTPRPDLGLAAAPAPPGRHGLPLPGLLVVSEADIGSGATLPERNLIHLVAHGWWARAARFPAETDAWLTEGLPMYTALLFLESREGPDRLEKELRALETESAGLPALAAPGTRPAREIAAKAALVLHALREACGQAAFSGALAAFATTNGGAAATTSSVLDILQPRCDADLAALRRDWIDGARPPADP